MKKIKRKLKLVKIKEEYLDYLRKYENRISYTKEEKIRRPFVGILFKIEDMLYYAPLTHKEKDSNETNIRINDSNGKFKGYILFNNMIPVNKEDIINYDINKEIDYKYKNIVYNQMLFLRKNYYKIIEKALNVYKGIVKKEHKSICFNFKELESLCKEYNNFKQYNEL